MPAPDPANHPRNRRGAFWREGEVLLLIALVAAAYFLRAGELTIRGEESRWATVAQGMIASGDWVVPRQFGEPFLSRPPLGNWLIALTTLLRGQCDVWAIRLPTLLAMLLTTLLVYAVGRSFLGRLGALSASLAFATMGEVLQMGRVAETDLLFTFLLSAAVLTWLWGEVRGWRPIFQWALGYGFAGLAALAKGPQAPVYFFGTVAIYLLLRGQLRRLLDRKHWVGVGVFAGIVAAWQIPFTFMAGWDATIKIWTGDSAARFTNLSFIETLRHLATYPLEVLGCTAPWSLFLAAFLSRRFRRSVATLRPVVLLLAIYVAIGFVPCWITPGGMTRYCLPLYPALALLIGLVVERAAETALSPRLQWAWTFGWKSFAAAFAAITVAIVAVTVLPVPAAAKPWAQSFSVCVGFAAAAAIGIRILVGINAASGAKQLRQGVATLAMLMALTYSGLIVTALAARSNDPRPEIAAVKARVPADARLVGFNDVHHLFAYYFGLPIELQPLETADADWFCFNSVREYRPRLPFEWEEVAAIPVDRNRHAQPENVVVIGRRLSPLRAAQRISSGVSGY